MATNSTAVCSYYVSNLAVSRINDNKWQVNGLMLSNAILMAFVVCIGANAPRYRRHPLLGFILLAATTLFLPIVSIVVSTVRGQHVVIKSGGDMYVGSACTSLHFVLALVWTGLVLTIGVTTSEIVAGDSREGRTIGPPSEKLVKTVWIVYLTRSIILSASTKFEAYLIFLQLFVIMFAKLLFKYIAFYKARRSLALGCSPRLIAGYMAQQRLLGESQSTAPALLVMGEETVKREEQPHGYNFKGVPKPDENGHRLVTLDRVWQLDDILVTSQPKDLCFSFALFKLLRCRFAKYTVSESGFMKAHNFFKDMLLQGDDSERVFRVVADELALIYYYYHSSLPIFYSSHLLLPIFTIAISLYNIGYCLFLMIFISRLLMNGAYNKIFCSFVCFKYNITDYAESGDTTVEYNSSTYYTDVVPAFLVLAALIFAETRDIVFYICSTWTKVALICNYVNRPSWQRCPAAQKCIAFVLQHFRCTMAGNNWGDNMKQFSILELHPKKFRFQLHKWKENSKIPSEVKAAIFETLKRKNLTTDLEGNLKVIRPPSSLFSSWAADHTGDSFLSAPDGKGAAYTILVWHIATTVFEIRRQAPPSSSDPHAIAATHLSHYCAYLVAFCPELLPSDEQWCKKMYMDVEKDAKRILKAVKGRKKQTGSHDQLCQLLTEDSSHEVLRNGARLGMQLADSATMGWEDLSRFWSEMILYVAPSENLDGHAQAIARGGELITLLWAMLAHAGILGRLDATAGDSDKAVTDTDGCAEV